MKKTSSNTQNSMWQATPNACVREREIWFWFYNLQFLFVDVDFCAHTCTHTHKTVHFMHHVDDSFLRSQMFVSDTSKWFNQCIDEWILRTCSMLYRTGRDKIWFSKVYVTKKSAVRAFEELGNFFRQTQNCIISVLLHIQMSMLSELRNELFFFTGLVFFSSLFMLLLWCVDGMRLC